IDHHSPTTSTLRPTGHSDPCSVRRPVTTEKVPSPPGAVNRASFERTGGRRCRPMSLADRAPVRLLPSPGGGRDRGSTVQLELLAAGYGLVEGPRTDGEDNLYFTDIPGGS